LKDYSSLSDEEITEAIRSSDTKAFQTLYYRYYESLYRFLWIRSRSVELSKDFVQEVYTRVWQKRLHLDKKKSIKAFLYRIANNLLIDHFRKKGYEKKYLSDLTVSGSSSYQDPLEMKTMIESGIDELPEKIREVLILSRFQGLSYREIAKVCHISVKTVEARMSQALKRLREILLTE